MKSLIKKIFKEQILVAGFQHGCQLKISFKRVDIKWVICPNFPKRLGKGKHSERNFFGLDIFKLLYASRQFIGELAGWLTHTWFNQTFYRKGLRIGPWRL